MSTELEYEAILDRKKHKKDFDNHFANVQKLLQDIANYGSNLIPRCFVSSKRRLEDIIIIGTLLRQIIAMVDATEILISNAAVYSSQLQARAGFEASIYIDWILKNDSEKKAKYYYVANLRKDKLWAQRTIGESPDQAEFDKMTKELTSLFIKQTEQVKEEAKKQIVKIDQLLASPAFNDINNAFQSYKDIKHLHYEPSWYKPLEIQSIRQIAIDVGRLPEYEIFYSKTSEMMHSSSYRQHIQFTDGKLIFEPIRSLKEIKMLINFTVACTLRTYRNILKHYRYGELPAFSKKYLEDWRTAFRDIKSVRYSLSPESTSITI